MMKVGKAALAKAVRELTARQREAARIVGISLEAYAEGVVKLQRLRTRDARWKRRAEGEA